MKFHAPCRVLVHGIPVNLRRVAKANAVQKQRGWKGLVAYVQGPLGTGLCEYRLLRPDPAFNYERLRKNISKRAKALRHCAP